MTSTPTHLFSADRFRSLAEMLLRNADILADNADLPEEVTGYRVEVYADVADQARMLAEAETARAAALAVVLPLTAAEAAERAAGELQRLAGVLANNARKLVRFTTDPAMVRRAGVYRDVAAQLRLLAEAELEDRPRPTPPAAPARVPEPSRIAVLAAQRVPAMRPEFAEPLVAAIAARRGRGWSVARLTLWLRGQLRDPQTGWTHPCADRSFVSYVTRLLTGAPAAAAA